MQAILKGLEQNAVEFDKLNKELDELAGRVERRDISVEEFNVRVGDIQARMDVAKARIEAGQAEVLRIKRLREEAFEEEKRQKEEEIAKLKRETESLKSQRYLVSATIRMTERMIRRKEHE